MAAGLGREALHSQVAAGLDAVVHIERDRHGRRRIAGIHTLARTVQGYVEAVEAVHFSDAGVTFGVGHHLLGQRLGMPTEPNGS